MMCARMYGTALRSFLAAIRQYPADPCCWSLPGSAQQKPQAGYQCRRADSKRDIHRLQGFVRAAIETPNGPSDSFSNATSAAIVPASSAASCTSLSSLKR